MSTAETETSPAISGRVIVKGDQSGAPRELALIDAHVISGHDPRMMERHPPAGDDLRGVAARVELDPLA